MSGAKSKAGVPNPVEASLYTLSDVVRYLGIPVWAAFFFRGQPSPVTLLAARPFPCDGAGVQGSDDDFNSESMFPRASFQELARFFVKSAVLHALCENCRLQDFLVEPSIDWPKSNKRNESFSERTAAEVVRWADKHFRSRVSDDVWANVKKVASTYADRVDVEDGVAIRLYPFSRDVAASAPRMIVIDPRKRFGQPTIAGTGVPTEVVGERFKAGDSVAALAVDYDVSTEQIEEAVRYECGIACFVSQQ